MGGKGSGGRRSGSGRKPKDSALGELTGSRRVRERNKARGVRNQTAAGNQNEPDAPTRQDVPMLDPAIPLPPTSITLDELAEWNDLAPRAFAKGTLTADEIYALRDLCQLRVLKERLLRTINDNGTVVTGANGQLAAHPLLTRITTLSQRIEAGMSRFQLSPMGKAVEPATKAPKNDQFSEFDESGDESPAKTH